MQCPEKKFLCCMPNQYMCNYLHNFIQNTKNENMVSSLLSLALLSWQLDTFSLPPHPFSQGTKKTTGDFTNQHTLSTNSLPNAFVHWHLLLQQLCALCSLKWAAANTAACFLPSTIPAKQPPDPPLHLRFPKHAQANPVKPRWEFFCSI